MRAHEFYLEALQLEPRRAELHAKVAAAHRTIGNLDAALASYDRAVSLGGDPGIELLRAAVDTAIAGRRHDARDARGRTISSARIRPTSARSSHAASR